jgi:hypothetical protein
MCQNQSQKPLNILKMFNGFLISMKIGPLSIKAFFDLKIAQNAYFLREKNLNRSR